MHKSNFSLLEKNLFKTVTQLTMLPQEHIELSTNGETEQYNAFKKYKPGRPEAGGYFEFYVSYPGVNSGLCRRYGIYG